MDKKEFQGTLSVERKILYYGAIALLFALVIQAVLLQASDPTLPNDLLLVSGLSFAAMGLIGLLLFLCYRHQPVVSEKTRIAGEFNRIEGIYNDLSSKIDDAGKERVSIDAWQESALQQRRWAYQQQRTELDKRRLQIDDAQKGEIQSSLASLQQRYVADGLKASLVRDARIPGVGPKLRQRLISSGIHNAAQVSTARVGQVSGFGEAKTTSVVAWRIARESFLKNKMPNRLPPDVESGIKRKHQQHRSQLAQEEQEASAALKVDLAQIETTASQRHVVNDNREAEARQQLAVLTPQRDELASELASYSGITLTRFFVTCLQPVPGKVSVHERLLTILIPSLFALSVLIQGGAALYTMGASAIEAISRARPVPTLTNVPADVDDLGRASQLTLGTEQVVSAYTSLASEEATVQPIATVAPALPPAAAPTSAVETPSPAPVPSDTPLPTPLPSSPGLDRVIAYNPGPGVKAQYTDPQALLGNPDLVESPCCQGMVQLGRGGSILAAFVDNVVVNGDGPDFQVFGESARDDFLQIEVSSDGITWRSYPKVSESPGGLDLAKVGLSRLVFVRLTDLQPATQTGAEVDAVVALHSEPGLGDLPIIPDAIARTALILYEGPDARMRKIGNVAADSPLRIEGRSSASGWVKVKTLSGRAGWCRAADLGLNVYLNGLGLVAAPPTPTPTRRSPTPRPPAPVPTVRVCCKICTVGKACGNTCINRNYTCHQPPGCACNGW